MLIRLSRLAKRDLDEVREYTVETWGRVRWIKYYEGLMQTFEEILENPDSGRDRSHFAAGLRSVNYGRHVIFYARVATVDDEPVIIRIVHQRRSLTALTYYENIIDSIKNY